ncbi:NAD-dependent epimerase/dehydratase [Halosimplex carlsbadense 2-9-1]|uniref:NAD-dependent epimerase/dehydratase n=1 Tax=Halosimplex carlsbadense 2-9-1 TaxID=797114 RepID=M0D4P2_9EURY|nr:NAD(P)-dependent oxidoreductase [Halosimplex carlsbadense]ELZ29129.1 NAD-dependent epimerase/dehydratase [Halosimplex carlsbadense 2-9-1]
MHLLVTGGNGFIGRRVCERAVADGHDVTSVARSGPPAPEHRESWTGAVEWVAADVFAPHEWRDRLATADRLVHSVGTIDEAPTAGVTFERINGDSALVAALEAERAGVDRVVYVSSSTKPPLVREAYLTARRRAEAAIADLDPTVVVPRFGPVYGPDQPHFPAVANRLFAAVGRFEPVARLFGVDLSLIHISDGGSAAGFADGGSANGGTVEGGPADDRTR